MFDLLERLQGKKLVKFDLTGMLDQGTDDNIKTLLTKQECNFKALDRAMSKINIDSVSERWMLEDHLSILKSKWNDIDKLHWELEALLKGSNSNYYNMFVSMEDKYDEMRNNLNSKIWSNVHYERSAPKIEIPEFSGKYTQWISFKDLFLETIHNNPMINKAQKMQHLKTRLRGEAERLVQHLSISADNYASCWEILTQRYDNQRLQITSFLNTMLNLPVIQHPDSFSLKKMHDVISECLNGLTNIGLDISTWDPIIVHLMSQKIYATTYGEYMKDLRDPREAPHLNEFLYFLENKFMAYESMKNAKKEIPNSQKQAPTKTFNKNYPTKLHNYERQKSVKKTYHTTFGQCPFCDEKHILMQCPKFLDMDSFQRNDTVAKLNLCKNCLYSHGNSECVSTKTCKECSMKHHTLLHKSAKKNNTKHATNNGKNNEGLSQRPSTSSQQQSSNHVSTNEMEILLTTVQLKIKSVDGTYITLRALLDQGSQVNLITENAAQLLRLPRHKLNATITGIGAASGNCKGQLQLTCQSIHSDYTFQTSVLILNKLTNNLPSSSFSKANWPHLENLKLADPEFNISRPVDLLLGADVYSDIILDGVLKGSVQTPIAQHTQLGWILCGKLKTFNCHVTLIEMTEISKFWENEDIAENTQDMSQDNKCEEYYSKTVQRTSDGKYIVKMPLCPEYEEKLGNSKSIAISQFLQLEKRFRKNEKLALTYKDFIKEYIELRHMKLATQITTPVPECYLPHHGVLREHATTTKLRVVFNASQKTNSGFSLNSLMEKGPNLQKDIQALVLKWRSYKYAYTADIEKMYRCIWTSEDQQQLQKIIWRDEPTQKLQEYQLCTVTYGTKCAPWLAMRTLKQLAIDDGHKHPNAAYVLQNEFYVDDLVSGHNTIDGAKHLQKSLIELLQGGGMNLRKWSVNHPVLLEGLAEEQISPKNIFNFKTEESNKTLGLGWNTNTDTFTFNWDLNKEVETRLTKRSLLSEISKLYDPLGWLAPVTVAAKLLFQRVWSSKLGWDETLPNDIQYEWTKLNKELPEVKNIQLNRWLSGTQENIELIGFCDASEKAYSCVVYTRIMNVNSQPHITLLAAKTRVAPLSQKTTLPRLELCGALLLSQLIEKIKQAYAGYDLPVQAYCDSQVVLAWLQGATNRWESYVANRVTKIKNIIPPENWHYVKSLQNPADCASRGMLPTKLINFNLWWNGPELLKTNIPKTSACLFITNIDCVKVPKSAEITNQDTHFIHHLIKCSSLTRIIRIIAWILRFITNVRNKKKSDTDYLTASELSSANEEIIKYVQRMDFAHEYKQIKKQEIVSNKSPIYKLNPILDTKGIIRVGGRLTNSNLPSAMKNPIILSRNGWFTKLLIEQAHMKTLHGGARLTLSYLRQRYWIIGGNRAVKTQLRNCVRCHRYKPCENYQLMGDLPQQRVTPSRPFTHTGVDFTGKVEVKLNKGRGVKTSKGYIAIFVCMATKAVHIELVSDLSTEAFIAAFQRMCARRGTPKHMYSDCGTNFIGASKLLHQEFEEYKQILSTDFFNEISTMEVEWHFNAPAWPSAGGLWEAAVKSMKHHLHRVLGDQKLTYEEFSTLLTKIEACMNSRPLCPLTEDPEEFYYYLTPGHFLTGGPVMTLPLSDYSDDRNIDLRQRWQLTENMLHHFWKSWSNDYLTHLQNRSKWNKPTTNIKEGDIVLVKDNNLPPGKWAMGRIQELHPGADGYVRVTSVKTQSGVIKRPIVKLSPLPISSDEKEHLDTIDVTPNPKKTPNRSKMTCFTTMFLTLLMMFTFITETYGKGNNSTHSAHITSLERERPIYYDTLGKMQTIHNEWTLLLYFNLTNYWNGVSRLETYLGSLNDLCEKTDPRYCKTTLQQLHHEMDLLTYYNNILLSPHKHLSNRRKRGLINGIGYVANSLFGILDQEFAEKYQRDIESIRSNENYLLELMKNQTSIVELENQILRKNEDNINKQFSAIDGFIKETDINFARIDTALEIMMATSYFNSASLATYLLINNLKKMQEMLFDTLTDVYKGHMDIHLLTPVNLIEQLNTISGRIPRSLSLPVENIREDIKDVYKLLYVKARVTTSYFLFEVHIPLTSDEDFLLYRAIPLPMRTESVTTILELTSKYIAVNFKKGTYISLTEEDVNHCVQLKAENFICNMNLPVFNLHNNNAVCEAKLLSHYTSSPCDVKKTSCNDVWIKLHAPNTWLAVCCATCTLRTICEGDVTTYTMTTSGIVSLAQECLLQSKDFTIYSHNQYSSNMKIDNNLNIPALDSSVNKIINITHHYVPWEVQHNNTSEAEIRDIDSRLASQKEKESLPAPITSHDIHQFAICYSLLGAAIIATILWFVKRHVIRSCTRPTTTQPINSTYEEIELQPVSRARRSGQEEAPRGSTHYSSVQRGAERPRRKPTAAVENIAFDFNN